MTSYFVILYPLNISLFYSLDWNVQILQNFAREDLIPKLVSNLAESWAEKRNFARTSWFSSLFTEGFAQQQKKKIQYIYSTYIIWLSPFSKREDTHLVENNIPRSTKLTYRKQVSGRFWQSWEKIILSHIMIISWLTLWCGGPVSRTSANCIIALPATHQWYTHVIIFSHMSKLGVSGWPQFSSITFGTKKLKFHPLGVFSGKNDILGSRNLGSILSGKSQPAEREKRLLERRGLLL